MKWIGKLLDGAMLEPYVVVKIINSVNCGLVVLSATGKILMTPLLSQKVLG